MTGHHLLEALLFKATICTAPQLSSYNNKIKIIADAVDRLCRPVARVPDC
jgi:hypothetical protein